MGIEEIQRRYVVRLSRSNVSYWMHGIKSTGKEADKPPIQK
jgi:hypothetical protein